MSQPMDIPVVSAAATTTSPSSPSTSSAGSSVDSAASVGITTPASRRRRSECAKCRKEAAAAAAKSATSPPSSLPACEPYDPARHRSGFHGYSGAPMRVVKVDTAGGFIWNEDAIYALQGRPTSSYDARAAQLAFLERAEPKVFDASAMFE
ncbi:hypothetical protein H9P43_007380 [Blastocladiella emersonii ATCC 22665]|nr:hypothetical protein H9P43_007380 [Blastocladiella emersonii ATCC 22665]